MWGGGGGGGAQPLMDFMTLHQLLFAFQVTVDSTEEIHGAPGWWGSLAPCNAPSQAALLIWPSELRFAVTSRQDNSPHEGWVPGVVTSAPP